MHTTFKNYNITPFHILQRPQPVSIGYYDLVYYNKCINNTNHVLNYHNDKIHKFTLYLLLHIIVYNYIFTLARRC